MGDSCLAAASHPPCSQRCGRGRAARLVLWCECARGGDVSEGDCPLGVVRDSGCCWPVAPLLSCIVRSSASRPVLPGAPPGGLLTPGLPRERVRHPFWALGPSWGQCAQGTGRDSGTQAGTAATGCEQCRPRPRVAARAPAGAERPLQGAWGCCTPAWNFHGCASSPVPSASGELFLLPRSANGFEGSLNLVRGPDPQQGAGGSSAFLRRQLLPRERRCDGESPEGKPARRGATRPPTGV